MKRTLYHSCLNVQPYYTHTIFRLTYQQIHGKKIRPTRNPEPPIIRHKSSFPRKADAHRAIRQFHIIHIHAQIMTSFI